jgi:hypothetical protein
MVIDGYEQLSWFARFRLKRWCRHRACGLLIATHQPMGLPESYSTRVTDEIAREVVDFLTDAEGARFTAMLNDRLAHHSGNLREVLFDLYDLHELTGAAR